MKEETNEGLVLKSEINIYSGASMLSITTDEQIKIQASFDAKEIEIRPDGLIYLPQTFWRKRLNNSFGIGQWCLIVKSSHQDANKLYLQGILMVRGSYVAESVGEAEYHKDNPLQSWASVWESAKSDSITRGCKDLGIASELWQPEFIRKWIETNAVKVWIDLNKGKGEPKKKAVWRKKDATPFWNEDSGRQEVKKPEPKKTEPDLKTKAKQEAIVEMKLCKNNDEVKACWIKWKSFQTDPEFIALKDQLKNANTDLDNFLREIETVTTYSEAQLVYESFKTLKGNAIFDKKMKLINEKFPKYQKTNA
jgi:hypothetical protein